MRQIKAKQIRRETYNAAMGFIARQKRTGFLSTKEIKVGPLFRRLLGNAKTAYLALPRTQRKDFSVTQ